MMKVMKRKSLHGFKGNNQDCKSVMSIQNKEKSRDYVTSREASLILGVALSTVQLWTENGLLHAWKTGGGHRRISRASVDKILQEQQAAFSNSSEKQRKSNKQDTQTTILIVEDDPLLLDLYTKTIMSWREDINVVSADNGLEGLIKIGRFSPDIIITDLLMTGINGFQIVEAISAFPDLEQCLTVIVSVLPEEDVKDKMSDGTEMVYFQKPVPFDLLRKEVERHLSRTHKVVEADEH